MKSFLIVIPFAVIGFCSCTGKYSQTKEQADALAATEKTKKEFDPNFNQDTSKLQIILTMRVKNGVVSDTPISVMIIPALKAAYVDSSLRTFSVSFSDTAKRNLGSLAIQDPLQVRTCDDPKKPAAITNMVNGQFSIVVPYSTQLQFITITGNSANKDFRPVEVDVRKFLNQRKK